MTSRRTLARTSATPTARSAASSNDPGGRGPDDRDHIVLGPGTFGGHGFNHRVGVAPRGLGFDGINSKAWPSDPHVGYPEGPLKIVTLSAPNTEKYCRCTFFGNGNYNPECVGR